MRKSAIARLTLPALVAGSLLAGAAYTQPVGAQSMGQPGPMINTGPAVGTPVGGSGMMIDPAGNIVVAPTPILPPGAMIAPSGLVGAGPPIDGLDSNPYADAPERVKQALGATGRANQSARSGSATRGARPSGTGMTQ